MHSPGTFGSVNVCICLDSSLDLLREYLSAPEGRKLLLGQISNNGQSVVSTLKVTLSMNTSIMQYNT